MGTGNIGRENISSKMSSYRILSFKICSRAWKVDLPSYPEHCRFWTALVPPGAPHPFLVVGNRASCWNNSSREGEEKVNAGVASGHDRHSGGRPGRYRREGRGPGRAVSIAGKAPRPCEACWGSNRSQWKGWAEDGTLTFRAFSLCICPHLSLLSLPLSCRPPPASYSAPPCARRAPSSPPLYRNASLASPRPFSATSSADTCARLSFPAPCAFCGPKRSSPPRSHHAAPAGEKRPQNAKTETRGR